MKRTALLVDYASSEEEDNDARVPEPPPKKKKLPPLASNLTVPVPVDNPALHQGRTRSSPHVEGQWASYVYVPLKVARGSALDALLDDIFRRAQELVPALRSIWAEGDSDAKERELHISLTRPVYLRAHQRDEFRTAVRAICRKHQTFPASFTTFAELTNDERTRTFLTIELGAGHKELETLCNALTPTLRMYRQKEFYDQPRFHASIAWALLSRSSAEPEHASSHIPGGTVSTLSKPPESSIATRIATQPASNPSASPASAFQTIPAFPQDLIPTLESEFGAALRSRHVGTFEAECLCIKIGKDVNRYKLRGDT